jgi:hypothetical protein
MYSEAAPPGCRDQNIFLGSNLVITACQSIGKHQLSSGPVVGDVFAILDIHAKVARCVDRPQCRAP